MWLWLFTTIMKRYTERCALQLNRASLLNIFIMLQYLAIDIFRIRSNFKIASQAKLPLFSDFSYQKELYVSSFNSVSQTIRFIGVVSAVNSLSFSDFQLFLVNLKDIPNSSNS